MPVKKGSRFWDPSRRVPSTHRASPVRTYVYEQLGISKPGFWADWRKRTIEEPEPEEFTPDEENEINDPSQEYHLAKWPEEKAAAKKDFTTKFPEQAAAPASGGGGKHSGPAWAPILENQSKQWFKSNPLLTTNSTLSLMGLEKAIANQQAADMLYGKGEGGTGAAGLLALAQFYGHKAQERAIARSNRPFGAGEPTNFDKMMALVGKPKPIYKPPTYQVLTQGTSKLVAKVPSSTIGQLNVSQNGYVSSRLPPQKQASNMIASAAKLNTGTSTVPARPTSTAQTAGTFSF